MKRPIIDLDASSARFAQDGHAHAASRLALPDDFLPDEAVCEARAASHRRLW
jgi:hypothetical protein